MLRIWGPDQLSIDQASKAFLMEASSYSAPETGKAAKPPAPDLSGFTKAQRHSRLVARLRYILPIFVVVAIGTFLYASGAFAPSRKLETRKFSAEVESIQLDKDSVIMMNPRLVTKGKTQGNYELTARTATRRISDPNRFILVGVNARMKKKSGGWSILRADHGIYDKKTDMLNLKTNVEMRSDNGQIARMDTARMNVKQGTLVTDSPVVVDMPNGVIRANGMTIRERGKIFRFEKRAHMKLNLNRKGQEK